MLQPVSRTVHTYISIVVFLVCRDACVEAGNGWRSQLLKLKVDGEVIGGCDYAQGPVICMISADNVPTHLSD